MTATGLPRRGFRTKSRSEQATHFEREKGRISFSNNVPSVPLQPGAQDQLGVLVQLGALLVGDPARYANKYHQRADRQRARCTEWFACLAPEELELPGGTVNTVKLVREPRGGLTRRWRSGWHSGIPVHAGACAADPAQYGDFVDQRWLSTDKTGCSALKLASNVAL